MSTLTLCGKRAYLSQVRRHYLKSKGLHCNRLRAANDKWKKAVLWGCSSICEQYPWSNVSGEITETFSYLELSDALMGAHPAQITLWADSTAVLTWLNHVVIALAEMTTVKTVQIWMPGGLLMTSQKGKALRCGDMDLSLLLYQLNIGCSHLFFNPWDKDKVTLENPPSAYIRSLHYQTPCSLLASLNLLQPVSNSFMVVDRWTPPPGFCSSAGTQACIFSYTDFCCRTKAKRSEPSTLLLTVAVTPPQRHTAEASSELLSQSCECASAYQSPSEHFVSSVDNEESAQDAHGW